MAIHKALATRLQGRSPQHRHQTREPKLGNFNIQSLCHAWCSTNAAGVLALACIHTCQRTVHNTTNSWSAFAPSALTIKHVVRSNCNLRAQRRSRCCLQLLNVEHAQRLLPSAAFLGMKYGSCISSNHGTHQMAAKSCTAENN